MQQQGVEVQVTLTGIGFSKGISYNLDGVALSGTQLGKAYTFSGLQKHRGVSYDKGRDNALIKALMQPQHLANAPGEAEENELEWSQSELAASAPATPATANELELQLSILPERNETSVAKSAIASRSRVQFTIPFRRH